MSIEEKIVTTGDIQTKYLDAGSGKPIILVHGSGHTPRVWKSNIKPLAKTFRVIVPEVVDSNRTDMGYVIPFYNRWIANFIDQLKIQEATLVGHSLGGAIAFHYVATSPNSIKKLILIAPVIFPILFDKWGLKKRSPKIQKILNHQVSIPVMVIWGEEDNILPIPPQNEILKAIPNARIERLPNCGHRPMSEYPAIFHQLVHDFIEEKF